MHFFILLVKEEGNKLKNLVSEIAGRQIRMGYTTGSCAAAAAKAAAFMFVRKKKIDWIEIDTPVGIPLRLPIIKAEIGKDFAKCCVVKDGGEDADITTGIEIFAEARFTKKDEISIMAGEGIGIVTKKGLKVAPGQPAINPVPRKMIQKEVSEIQKSGIEIILSVPEGEERAKKTFNPRLGIQGGISIIGTSGIVMPMSEEAWKDSIYLELKMKKALRLHSICYVFGNYGEEFAQKQLGIEKDKILNISNFVGYFLESAVNLKLKDILLIGHMGKLAKVAAGNFHTHNKISDARLETICTFAALEGASKECIEALYSCVTTEAAQEILEQYHLKQVYQRIVDKAEQRCLFRIYEKIKIGCILFGKENKMLAKSKNAEEIINKIRNENIE